MKRKKLFALAASCLIATSGLVLSGITSCGGGQQVEDGGDTTTLTIVGGGVTLTVGEKTTLKAQDKDGKDVAVTWSSSNSAVASVNASGEVTGLSAGSAKITAKAKDADLSATTTITVTAAGEDVDAELASGLVNLYQGDYATNPESGQINNSLLGIQEKYIMDEFLTGIPMVADSSYQMYSERVVLPVDTYQDLMGFGGTAYVEINGTLSGLATNDPYKTYYHLGTSEDPQEIFSADSNNSSVDALAGLTTLPLWNYKFNEAKNGGVLYAVTSKEDLPIVVDANEKGEGKTFRIHVRTEADGLKYTYAGSRQLPGFTKDSASGLWTRGVKAEDYLTVLRLALTQVNGLYRGAEMAGDQYTQKLKGSTEYYQSTKDTTGLWDESLWANVGAQCGKDDDGEYIEFTTDSTFTASNFRDSFQGLPYYSPLPMDAVEAIGIKNYGKFTEDRKLSPVDNTVSVGPYTLVNWVTDKEITFKKNSVYQKLPAEAEMFNHDGIDYVVYTGAKTDQELLFNEFIANKLDTATIPPTKLEQYMTDKRTKEIPDEGTWKLNVNACSEEVWEKLFGKNGTVYSHAEGSYWDVKPIMSNKDFLSGLFFAMNRNDIAKSTGYSPTLNYFSSAYMGYTYNEDGTRIKWNDTPEHQANLADWYPETFGFDENAAIIYFQRALEAELEKGTYEVNTDKSKPITITLIAKWMTQNNVNQIGEPAAASIETIANKAWESYGYKLDIVNQVAGATSDDCYNALKRGEFDLGMGAITGYALDPLGLTQIFCSDNRSGFTLNWGPDTSIPDKRLTWDGKYYSFDGFYTACYGGAIFKDGNAIEAVTLDSAVKQESDKLVYTFTLTAVQGAGIQSLKVREVEIFNPTTYVDFFYQQNLDSSAETYVEELPEGASPLTVTAEVLSSYTTDDGLIGIYISYDVVTDSGTLSGQYFQFAVNGYKAA